jgi:hypothetical protein
MEFIQSFITVKSIIENTDKINYRVGVDFSFLHKSFECIVDINFKSKMFNKTFENVNCSFNQILENRKYSYNFISKLKNIILVMI